MDELRQTHTFGEAPDLETVLQAHQSAPQTEFLDAGLATSAAAPVCLTFAATVINVERTYDGSLDSEHERIQILPCGWPLESAVYQNVLLTLSEGEGTSDLEELLYQSYRFIRPMGRFQWLTGRNGHMNGLRYPEPVAVTKGACFGLLGVVTKVEGREVSVHVERNGSKGTQGWPRTFTLKLKEDTSLIVGGLYEFKGIVMPFAPGVDDSRFLVALVERKE